MKVTAAPDPLDDDGINPTRALILHAYWGLRYEHPAESIGTREISRWIRAHQRDVPVPSDSLIQLVVEQEKLAHRAPGRPRNDSKLPPFLPKLNRAQRRALSRK